MPTSPTGRNSRQGGFTLVELTLVVVLMVALAAVAAPAFAGFWRASQAKSCAWRIAALARAAREQAICRGARTSLQYDAEAREFRLAVEPDPVNAPGEFEGLELASARPAGIPDPVEAVDCSVEGQAADQARPVIFFPDGQALEAEIVLQASNGPAFSIKISALTGQARVIEGDVRKEE